MRKLIIFLLCGALFSTNVWADLQASLDSMFMSNATPSQGAYNSQSRGGYVGGSLSLRAPINNINLVAFDPPRMSAGCGGIDMYGGSFTFINAAQLSALFRQIAASAAGALFKMAIDSISPEIGKVMQDFQAVMQSLNGMMKNTCAIGTAIAHSIHDPVAGPEGAQAQAQIIRTGWGKTTDSFNAVLDDFTSSSSNVKDAASTGAMPGYGNLVWKALASSNAGNILGSANSAPFTQAPTAFGSAVTPILAASNEVVMSLLGTLIASQDVGPPLTGVNGAEAVPGGAWYPHTINLWDLKEKHPAGINIYRCKDGYTENQCQHIGPAVADTIWQGADGYVIRIMFGTTDGTEVVQPGSLISNLNSCATTNCTFTAEQKMFIATMSAPVLKLLKDVQNDSDAMGQVAAMLVPVMSLDILARYGEAAELAARNAFAGVQHATMPDEFLPRVSELGRQLAEIRGMARLEQNKITNAAEFVRLIKASAPSLWLKTPSGH